VQTYDGMVIGEHSRETDLEVSPLIPILDILVYGYLGYLALHYSMSERKEIIIS
jgi:hypothetical protein